MASSSASPIETGGTTGSASSRSSSPTGVGWRGASPNRAGSPSRTAAGRLARLASWAKKASSPSVASGSSTRGTAMAAYSLPPITTSSTRPVAWPSSGRWGRMDCPWSWLVELQEPAGVRVRALDGLIGDQPEAGGEGMPFVVDVAHRGGQRRQVGESRRQGGDGVAEADGTDHGIGRGLLQVERSVEPGDLDGLAHRAEPAHQARRAVAGHAADHHQGHVRLGGVDQVPVRIAGACRRSRPGRRSCRSRASRPPLTSRGCQRGSW